MPKKKVERSKCEEKRSGRAAGGAMSALVRSNSMRMVEWRGYEVEREDEEGIYGRKKSGEKFVVLYCDEAKVSVKRVRAALASNEKTSVVLVCPSGMTAFAKKEVAETGADVQVFTHAEINLAAATHSLVPDYELVDEEEKEEVIRRHKVRDESSFPRILPTDPFARYCGLRSGDMVKFKRQLGYNSDCSYYRIVS